MRKVCCAAQINLHKAEVKFCSMQMQINDCSRFHIGHLYCEISQIISREKRCRSKEEVILENKGEEEEKGCVKENMSVVQEEEKGGREDIWMCLSCSTA